MLGGVPLREQSAFLRLARVQVVQQPTLSPLAAAGLPPEQLPELQGIDGPGVVGVLLKPMPHGRRQCVEAVPFVAGPAAPVILAQGDVIPGQ